MEQPISRYRVVSQQDRPAWFCGCPIQLNMVRLVQDQLSGQVLLQFRALNVTDQPIKSVTFELISRDESGTILRVDEKWLVKNVQASPHSSFANAQPYPLPASTVSAELVCRLVFFCDGQVWEKPDFLQPKQLPEPTKIRQDDPFAEEMREQAEQAGLQARYYYEEHNDFWFCSCGQANPIAACSCGKCCANRDWVRSNMAKRAQRPQARPELGAFFGRKTGSYEPVLTPQPQPAAEEKNSEQLIADPRTGELITIEQYNALMRAMYYQRNDGDDLPRQPKSRQALWICLLIAAVLAAAAILLVPRTNLWRYWQAVSDMDAGEYEQAYEAFYALGDYRGAEQNALFCRYSIAMRYYDAGNYEQAGQLFGQLADYRDSADMTQTCLLARAQALMDAEEYEQAMKLLRDQTGAQAKALLGECAYDMGKQAQADGDYVGAISWYEQSGGYQDADSRIAVCEQLMEKESTHQTGAQDGMDGNPSLSEMYDYVLTHTDMTDATVVQYLEVLREADYENSREIYNERYAWKVELFFNSSANDLTTHLDTALAGQTIYAHYIVSGGPPNATLQMRYAYQKPNGARGEKELAEACTSGSTGNIYWQGGIYAEAEQQVAGKLQVSYYDVQTGEQLCSGSIQITLPDGQ